MTSYKLHELELAEYTRVLPKQSGINACIYIDECESYKRWNHPLWVIISDSDPYTDQWVALSISDNPNVLVYGNPSQNKNNILSWLDQCILFVSKFYNVIENISNELIDSDIIYTILSSYNWDDLLIDDINKLMNILDNELFLITETILRPLITNLPFSILYKIV